MLCSIGIIPLRFYLPLPSLTQVSRPRLRKLIIFSALACMARPTNAVIWVFLYSKLFWAFRAYWRITIAVAMDMAVIGLVYPMWNLKAEKN